MFAKIVIAMMLSFAPCVWAQSVLVYNVSQGRVEHSRDADKTRSIASLTKLMTAMVTLDYDSNLDRRLSLSKLVPGRLPPQIYTRAQLLKAMLINSDNAAAETLAQDYPGGRTAFISKMNSRARDLGLASTHFADASGLGVFNVSTAHDMANLVILAMQYPLIQQVSTVPQTTIELATKRRQTVQLTHTSGPLLMTFDNVLVSKTGMTNAAGWCVVMLVEQNNEKYSLVVLGSPTKTQRLETLKSIRNRYFDTNFVSHSNLS